MLWTGRREGEVTNLDLKDKVDIFTAVSGPFCLTCFNLYALRSVTLWINLRINCLRPSLLLLPKRRLCPRWHGLSLPMNLPNPFFEQETVVGHRECARGLQGKSNAMITIEGKSSLVWLTVFHSQAKDSKHARYRFMNGQKELHMNMTLVRFAPFVPFVPSMARSLCRHHLT